MARFIVALNRTQSIIGTAQVSMEVPCEEAIEDALVDIAEEIDWETIDSPASSDDIEITSIVELDLETENKPDIDLSPLENPRTIIDIVIDLFKRSGLEPFGNGNKTGWEVDDNPTDWAPPTSTVMDFIRNAKYQLKDSTISSVLISSGLDPEIHMISDLLDHCVVKLEEQMAIAMGNNGRLSCYWIVGEDDIVLFIYTSKTATAHNIFTRDKFPYKVQTQDGKDPGWKHYTVEIPDHTVPGTTAIIADCIRLLIV